MTDYDERNPLNPALLGNGAFTTTKEYTDEYLHGTADRAFNILGDNPSAEDFARVMNEEFERLGQEDLSLIVDDVVRTAAGPDGTVSRLEASNIAENLQSATRKIVGNTPEAAALLVQQGNEAVLYGLGELEKIIESGVSDDPNTAHIQNSVIERLGGPDAVRQMIEDSKQPGWEPEMLDPAARDILIDANNAQHTTVEQMNGPLATLQSFLGAGVSLALMDSALEIIGDMGGGLAFGATPNGPAPALDNTLDAAPAVDPMVMPTPTMGPTG